MRRREATAGAQLVAARARLEEALAELERARAWARARATKLQRRLEQTYGKRRRFVDDARGRIHETLTLLYDGRQKQLPAVTEPELDAAAASSSS